MTKEKYSITVKGLDSYKLFKFIEEEYTKSKLDNSSFAKYATERLGFTVNANNVFTRVRHLGIPNNRKVNAKEKAETRLTGLSNRITELESKLDLLIKRLFPQ